MSNFRRKDIRRQFFVKSQMSYGSDGSSASKQIAQMSNSFGLEFTPGAKFYTLVIFFL
jgi:hypothetical protein